MVFPILLGEGKRLFADGGADSTPLDPYRGAAVRIRRDVDPQTF